MRIRALFLLSILTFGCLSEAQPTPGGIKDALTATAIVMRLVAQLHLRQNTRTILQQEVSGAARAIMPRSPFHHAGPVHSSVMAHLQPPVIGTGIGALLQARPVHTSTTTLLTSSQLNAASQQVSDPQTPSYPPYASYQELILLGEALGLSRRGREMISLDVSSRGQESQAASSQQRVELSIDHTQVTTTVHRADDTVRISMNTRPQNRRQITTSNISNTTAAFTAMNLAGLSSIDYYDFLERGQRPSRLEFAEATIARIRQRVQNERFLYYLGIVEQNLDGSNTHESVMSQLNSDTSGRAAANGEWLFIDTAAALYFFFSEIQSQQALLNLVEQYPGHSEFFGTILMTLSVVREGGIRRDEFSVDEIRSLLESLPEGVDIRRDPDLFLVDPPADRDDPAKPGKKED